MLKIIYKHHLVLIPVILAKEDNIPVQDKPWNNLSCLSCSITYLSKVVLFIRILAKNVSSTKYLCIFVNVNHNVIVTC